MSIRIYLDNNRTKLLSSIVIDNCTFLALRVRITYIFSTNRIFIPLFKPVLAKCTRINTHVTIEQQANRPIAVDNSRMRACYLKNLVYDWSSASRLDIRVYRDLFEVQGG